MNKPAKRIKRPRPVAGWREWVSLPDLGVTSIKAKIDTGAHTSALHAYRVRPFTRDGRDRVAFQVHPVQRHRLPEIRCEAPLLGQRVITSSNGQRQRRYVIETTLVIGQLSWLIELTLANRDEMGFRMLLGRQALRRHLLIDPAKSYCLSAHPASGSTRPPVTEPPDTVEDTAAVLFETGADASSPGQGGVG